jgi:putative transposase
MSNYRRSIVPAGCFFFSVALADRRSTLLVDQISRLRQAYALTHRTLPFTTLAICVLPEHLHAVWTLPEHDSDYAGRWSLLKSSFSRGLPLAERLNRSQRQKREKGLWQRRYWEHQIRDAEDLKRHIDYLHFNPVKHGLVEQVKDWPYSSFHRHVRQGHLPPDWGGTGSSACLAGGEPDGRAKADAGAGWA